MFNRYEGFKLTRLYVDSQTYTTIHDYDKYFLNYETLDKFLEFEAIVEGEDREQLKRDRIVELDWAGYRSFYCYRLEEIVITGEVKNE